MCEWDKNYLLPPANKVWGKVKFLHPSVIHSVHMEGVVSSLAVGAKKEGEVQWKGDGDSMKGCREGECHEKESAVKGVQQRNSPPQSVNKLAVRILMECILVFIRFVAIACRCRTE